MTISIYPIADATAYPWHGKITAQCGKALAEGYERGEPEAIAASHATMAAIAEGDA
jgi:hypothetical protein